MVDASRVILKVGIDRESCFNWPSRHDHLLDGRLARRRLNRALEANLVGGPISVGSAGGSVARARAAGGGLGGAAGGPLGGEGIVALITRGEDDKRTERQGVSHVRGQRGDDSEGQPAAPSGGKGSSPC
jgi:hypothetical protein